MLRQFVAFSTIALARPQSIRQYRFLKKSQFWDEEAVLPYKEALLKEILEYAYVHCPYYREVLKGYEKCWKGKIFDWEIFYEIPVLEKDTVKNEFKCLHSDEIHRMKVRETRSGGSTGMPTRHMQDEHYRCMDMSNNLLFKHWGSVRPGDKCMHIAADEIDYFGSPVGWNKKLVDTLFNKFYVNAFNLNEEVFGNIVKLIVERKPKYIQVYTSVAYELAQFILRNEITVPSPKMIMCIAGTVYGEMLDVMEKAFNCKVYSRYGSRETGDMAGMCINRVYHEMPYTHHIDILDEQDRPVKAGEAGEIAITVLTNRAMPIIRYKIGDVGIWSKGPCKCGVKFRTLKKVVGRTGEIIKNSKGKIILPEIFIHLIGVMLGNLSDKILRFQIAQVELKVVEVRLVLREDRGPEFERALDDLKDKIIKVMEDDVLVKFVFLDDIPKLPSGKYCYTLSSVV